MEDFSLLKAGDDYILKRLNPPRFTALIDFEKPLPEIKQIKFLEYCSAEEYEKILKDAECFFESLKLKSSV